MSWLYFTGFAVVLVTLLGGLTHLGRRVKSKKQRGEWLGWAAEPYEQCDDGDSD